MKHRQGAYAAEGYSVPQLAKNHENDVPEFANAHNDVSYCYEINETFHESKLACAPIEGSGVLHPGGSFSLRGVVRMEPQGSLNLLVSCTGGTAIEQLAKRIDFWAKVTITKNGTLIDSKSLFPNPHGYIRQYPHDSLYIVGEASFVLPEPEDEIPLTVELEGSYLVRFNDGLLAPSTYATFGTIPAIVRKIFIIRVNIICSMLKHYMY